MLVRHIGLLRARQLRCGMNEYSILFLLPERKSQPPTQTTSMIQAVPWYREHVSWPHSHVEFQSSRAVEILV